MKADIVAMFEKYLNFKDELNQGIEILWDGQNSYETELPLIKIQTQREKSNFTVNILFTNFLTIIANRLTYNL